MLLHIVPTTTGGWSGVQLQQDTPSVGGDAVETWTGGAEQSANRKRKLRIQHTVPLGRAATWLYSVQTVLVRSLS